MCIYNEHIFVYNNLPCITILILFLTMQAEQTSKFKHTMSLWITLALERARRLATYNKVCSNLCRTFITDIEEKNSTYKDNIVSMHRCHFQNRGNVLIISSLIANKNRTRHCRIFFAVSFEK